MMATEATLIPIDNDVRGAPEPGTSVVCETTTVSTTVSVLLELVEALAAPKRGCDGIVLDAVEVLAVGVILMVDVDDIVLDAADEREGADELDEESDDDASGKSYL